MTIEWSPRYVCKPEIFLKENSSNGVYLTLIFSLKGFPSQEKDILSGKITFSQIMSS